ncbi:MAG: DUF5696 domain-containing protein [Bacillota bacterium]|nr:DUF5696 domain-containing protein [Bacillota bacterium]
MSKQPIYRQSLIWIVFLWVFLASLPVSAQPAGFEPAASNEYLTLYIDTVTTEIAVEDRTTGKLWFSNPQDRAATAKGTVLQRLSSQLTIVYNPNAVVKDNFRYSVAYEQYEITGIENGVRVDYTIVEEWKNEHYLPKMISAARMEELILSAIEKPGDKQRVVDAYYLIKLAPLGDRQRLEVKGVDQERVFGDYDLVVLDGAYQDKEAQIRQLEQELSAVDPDAGAKLESDITRLRQQLDKEKEEVMKRLLYVVQGSRGDLGKIDDITHGDVAQLIDTPTYVLKQIPPFLLTSVQNLVIDSGYTPLDACDDHEMNNIDPPIPGLEIFKVSIEYILDGADLLVRIPVKDLVYPIDVEDRLGEKYTFPLMRINVLEWFGAAGPGQEGYILVPDGSGALIYLNNGRINTSAYNEPVYGLDNALDLVNEVQRYPETIRLPVFGLKQGDQAFFAIIEEGAPLARIKADISGRATNYNQVYVEFNPLPSGEVSYSIEDVSSGSIPIYQARMYEGDFVIRYAFLAGDQADYVGMADCYRNYLIDRYGLSKVEPKSDIPFYLELVGAIDKRVPILGIARDVFHPLTSFNQTRIIIEELVDQEIGNIQLKYNGWLSGGMNHHYPDKAAPENVLGGDKEFRRLIEFMAQQDFGLYPSVGFLRVYRNSLFNSFNPQQDASRFLNRLPAKVHNYYLDTYERMESQFAYVLSPRKLGRLVDSFMEDYQKYGLASLSLFDMGREVNSDFIDDARRVIDRVQAEAVIGEQLRKLKSQGFKLMIDHGNACTLPYADVIINMPTTSLHGLINRSIPFYQIAVHGLIGYAGSPVNLASNPKAALLKMLETGANPYFIGSFAESFEVKNTEFEHLYALHYKDWLDLAVEFYQTANAVLRDVQDQLITDHWMPTSGVYQTVFENGKSIVVNYNKKDVELNGHLIDAEGFMVLEGGCYEE